MIGISYFFMHPHKTVCSNVSEMTWNASETEWYGFMCKMICLFRKSAKIVSGITFSLAFLKIAPKDLVYSGTIHSSKSLGLMLGML